MSDVKFILPDSETISITGQTTDLLIKARDGTAALLYLFILRTHGQRSVAEAAQALGKSTGDITAAMEILGKIGLIQYGHEGSADKSDRTRGVQMPSESQSDIVQTQTKQIVQEPRTEKKSESGIKKMPEVMLKQEPSKGGESFHMLVDEVQRSLGKILTPDELTGLFGIHDSLKLPPEVILQLITHCIEENRLNSSGRRMPTIRFIEKMAYKWEREGIRTLEKAETYIKELEKRRSVQGEIKRTLQIKDRELSPTERVYIDGWVEMGFNADAIDLAYDKTVLNTGKMAWSYMDSILKNWHSKGMHSKEDIVERDKKRAQTANVLLNPEKKTAPAPEELEQMKKLLRMIKEE